MHTYDSLLKVTLADYMYAMHESIASILSEQGFLTHVLDCKVCFNDQGADNLRLALYYLS